jgi:hypothetical protein
MDEITYSLHSLHMSSNWKELLLTDNISFRVLLFYSLRKSSTGCYLLILIRTYLYSYELRIKYVSKLILEALLIVVFQKDALFLRLSSLLPLCTSPP